MISDGSKKDGRISSAFILERPQHAASRVSGGNEIGGTIRDMDSYRGELGGVFGGLTAIEGIAIHHNIHSGEVRLGLDGADAMKNCQKEHLTSTMQSFDLLHAIQVKRKLIWACFRIKIVFF